ncbi:unnamed protein product [Plutella xylostella]|uniref:RNA-directed DNA polymerase n=1 Tax=Plutella xylostella TaxID=51655 RepID=A0A8S4D266_PLUXY|nr:unnamed protein product [Plutella xylostella]
MSIGKIGEFDVENGNWSLYCERLHMYFEANAIKEDLQLPTLIAVVGEATYELMVNLVSPKSPSQLKLEELVKVVQDHLQPTPSILAERYRFRQRRQESGESVIQYVAVLKKLSRFCDFGSALDDNLRDQFVCGLSMDVIRQRLFAEEKIQFSKAISLACSLEAAERDAAAVEVGSRTPGGAAAEAAVHKMAALRSAGAGSGSGRRAGGGGGGDSQRERTSQGTVVCACCGGNNHDSKVCRYKRLKCGRCNVVGHLRKMCPGNQQGGGAWRGGGPRGERAGHGNNGGRRATSSYANFVAQTDSDHSEEEEPMFQMALRSYKPVSMPVTVDGKELIMEIDTGHKNVLDGGLGRYTGGTARLRLREGAEPVFCRARPLPFAMRERVDLELDAMLRDGIIEPVDCSDWATPLVPINKSDGTLRLCADFKKCVFMADEVVYLGFIINKNGVRPDPKKLEAIKEMPTPTNVTEVRAFLGMVNFYAKFVRNISDILYPLYKLLRKQMRWSWTDECEMAFRKVKEVLLSSEVLAHYDPALPLVLTCDASARGVGGVLSQRDARGRERAVAYVSLEIDQLKPYYNRRHELYDELGCVMWGHRVIIPQSCREVVMRELHETHMGIVKTKAIARSYVWWPGLDEEIEQRCRACEVCAEVAPAPPAAPPSPWRWPDRAYERVHLDFLGPIGGKVYLVAVDARSKWIEVFLMTRTTSDVTIDKLREAWARWGLPKQVVTDNGPPFTSESFENFLSSNGVRHIFTPPYHPASNGAAENAVKIIKKVIKKANCENKRVDVAIQRFLLNYNNTPHSTTGESPAKLLQGRSLRCRLDNLKPDRTAKVEIEQNKQVVYSGGTVRGLVTGDEVWFREYRPGRKWSKGIVAGRSGRSDCTLEAADGSRVHRHIDQLRRRSRGSMVCPVESSMDDTREVEQASSSQVQLPAEAGGAPSEQGPPASEAPAAAEGAPAAGAAAGNDPTPSSSRYPVRTRKPVVRYGWGEID